MRFSIIPVTPYQQNCSLVWCEHTGHGVLIDPGGEADRLLAEVHRNNVRLDRLLLTHGHLDHVGAALGLSETLGIPIEGPHCEDAFWLEMLPRQAEYFGFPPAQAFSPHRWLSDGDRIAVGDFSLDVLHCPGHTPGHVVFFQAEARQCFVGDVLFKGSIGRTDFPRGDHHALLASIRDRLLVLGDDVRFVPGHGPMSTFGQERTGNPFLSEALD